MWSFPTLFLGNKIGSAFWEGNFAVWSCFKVSMTFDLVIPLTGNSCANISKYVFKYMPKIISEVLFIKEEKVVKI